MALYVIEMRNGNGGWDRIDPTPYINATGAYERAKELAAELATKDDCTVDALFKHIRIRDLDAQHPEFMLRMDWKLLREQKVALMGVQTLDAIRFEEEPQEAIEGIINLIDAVQDYAVDVMDLDDEQVFGVRTPEEDDEDADNE